MTKLSALEAAKKIKMLVFDCDGVMTDGSVTYDENGVEYKPEAPNAYKFESLILDMIYMMDDCLSFEVDREHEFAPVKNATGTDSVETARELLKKNGIEI